MLCRLARQVRAAPLATTRSFTTKKVFLPILRKFKQVNSDAVLPPSLFQQKIILVVNTASKCGLTPQLKSLQELHTRYAAKGLTVLAVPSNDFGAQEVVPEDDATLEAFYKSEYNVTFPITTKTKVLGDDAHPFYQAIVEHYTNEVSPAWNFEKFIVDESGDLRAVFPRNVDPLEPEVIETIENLLKNLAPPSPPSTTTPTA
ncbi:hypothetical protein DYB37_002577 [Aphanomyces astaci]|uniref:Glutathione peroxidase n=1 Tax=Aphanomyces astaci TaxID=112090 RepID=A0A3R7E7I3_APHAT|nr:hypothetical protein DYB35_005804 [Aphanomyces astaci]RHZ05142.1 hypothetical protein DYB37_002577 [Aphanomyces astaci]